MPDVTIIGGGPAGSTAAILLARGGWDVTLVEQSRFPRDKVCGECLSALGYDVLTRIGLAEQFCALGAVRLEHAEVHSPAGRAMRVALPVPMWGLSRRAFDGMLLDAARTSGAVIRQPMRCEAFDFTTRCLRLRNTVSNVVERVSPSQVILADGKAAFAKDRPPVSGDFGIKAHFVDVNGPRDAIELFGVRGSYGGLAAIEGRRWNAAFSVAARRLKAYGGDLDALFNAITAENAVLTRRLAGARRVSPWLASPLPRFPLRTSWPAGVFPVGNAAAAVEPIGGEGMGLAMRSAELVARALIASGGRDASRPGRLLAQLRALWRTPLPGCRAAGLVVSSPTAMRALTSFGLSQAAERCAVSLVGKRGAIASVHATPTWR